MIENQGCSREKNKIAIFDMDGTLYNMHKLWLAQAWGMILYYIVHPTRIKELYGMYYYYRLAEDSRYSNMTEAQRYKSASKKSGCGQRCLRRAVTRWMYDQAGRLAGKFAYQNVLTYMSLLKSHGYKIVIYSDFNADNKIKALSLKPDYVFYPSNKTFTYMKPSSEAMQYIMKETQADPTRSIYVGDRPDKDEASAKLAGIRYVDVKSIR